MARLDFAHPDNVEGPWFVDTRCIRCDVARHWAPGLIEMDSAGRSYLARQARRPGGICCLVEGRRGLSDAVDRQRRDPPSA